MSENTDLAEYGMEYARKQGATYSEARLIDGDRVIFTLRNGNLVSGSELPWRGIGFRVLSNG
ncbi:MAG: TldD/PmbA family protein, partial [Candidatus Hodarchaeales archaeon]